MSIDDRLRTLPDGGPLDVDAALRSVRKKRRRDRERWIGLLAVALVVILVAGVVVANRDGHRSEGGGVSLGKVLPTGFTKASVGRATDPSSDLVPDVVAADSMFGLDLFDQIAADPNENVFISPMSIATALTMTYAGARGDTAAQLADGLGITGLGERVHEGRNALDLMLSAPRQAFTNPFDTGSPGEPLSLKTVNSLWGQAGFSLLEPFLETLARDYDAGMNTVDFERAAEDARVTINKWVADNTSPSITELLKPGLLDELTRLVLVNTVSFKGSWLTPFDPAATVDGTFTRADGSHVTVPMMKPKERVPGERAARLGYTHTAGWQAVRLPYVGGASMTVLLPDQPNATLEEQTWTAIEKQPGDAVVHLTMPKFAFTANTSLVEPLGKLGVRDLFDPSTADLSGVDGQRDLYIKAVVHSAAVDVDEYGTTASAATAALFELSSGVQDVTVTFDRPFTFVIQDDATKEVLFVGRVADPTAR
jgi:serpin B